MPPASSHSFAAGTAFDQSISAFMPQASAIAQECRGQSLEDTPQEVRLYLQGRLVSVKFFVGSKVGAKVQDLTGRLVGRIRGDGQMVLLMIYQQIYDLRVFQPRCLGTAYSRFSRWRDVLTGPLLQLEDGHYTLSFPSASATEATPKTANCTSWTAQEFPVEPQNGEAECLCRKIKLQ